MNSYSKNSDIENSVPRGMSILWDLCVRGKVDELKWELEKSENKISYLQIMSTHSGPITWAARQNREEIIAYLINDSIVSDGAFIKEAIETAVMYGASQVIDYFCTKAPIEVVCIALEIVEEKLIFTMRQTNLQACQRLKQHEPLMREIIKAHNEKQDIEQHLAHMQKIDVPTINTNKI